LHDCWSIYRSIAFPNEREQIKSGFIGENYLPPLFKGFFL